jgi:hypothetical protein
MEERCEIHECFFPYFKSFLSDAEVFRRVAESFCRSTELFCHDAEPFSCDTSLSKSIESRILIISTTPLSTLHPIPARD